MAILKALPGSAKINGKPVKGKLIQVKKSVINIDKFLESRKEQTKKQIEDSKKETTEEAPDGGQVVSEGQEG